jgi:hypothetical protein
MEDFDNSQGGDELKDREYYENASNHHKDDASHNNGFYDI